ncbi:MAG TPA: DNRLRE domain-containing protein [Fibrobacteria bacterium]|nr:DNRLRE domain-containing protein [Fibrobacteria bacterium]
MNDRGVRALKTTKTRENGWLRLLLGWAMVLLAVWGCDSGSAQPTEPRQAGVITTGNTGRVQGRVLAGGWGVPLDVRLLQETVSGPQVWAVSNSDDSGVFAFSSAPSGRYRVEAWWHGVLKGRSGTFVVDGDVSGIVVLVIGPTRLSLDLKELEPVDSVFVDYPSNPGRREGSLWSVQVLRDSAFVLHTHRIGGRWEQWEVVSQAGGTIFRNLSDHRSLDFLRKVDTSAYLVEPRTVALWTFDSLDGTGGFPDLSGHGHALQVGRAALVPSPHGKALDGGALEEGRIATTAGSTVPQLLRWSATLMQTIEIRFFLESMPLSGITLVGTKIGPQIMVSPMGALSVAQQVVPAGQSTPAWSVFNSLPGKIPTGRWIDLVVSIDAADAQIYAWIGETPLDLYAERAGGGVESLVAGVDGSFSVGGLLDDWRPGRYRIDEIRVSDTLVFGKGNPIQPVFESTVTTGLTMGGVAKIAGTRDLCAACALVELGMDSSGVEHAAYVKLAIPSQLKWAKVIVANLAIWADVAEDRSFGVYPLAQQWNASVVDPGGSWNRSWMDSLPHTVGPLFSGSTGGIVMNITDLLQKWIDDPSSNHGILIRSDRLDRQGLRVNTPVSGARTPKLFVSYR